MYWLSFADPHKPKGEQFLGATIIQANNFMSVITRSWRLGVNPGGEVKAIELDGDSINDLPPEAKKYYNKFVPRDEVMKEPYDKF